ncbi:hypothetical protein IJD15_00740 [bacterium]|nr:hypothetical protein [bacterium]
MKILIVGSDLNSLLLAKLIKTQNQNHDIYVTTADNSSPETYTAIRIRENDIHSIVEFVKYNGIEFTIAFSQISIINGIADAFKKEEFFIFAPYSEAARITFFNSIAKKILYKLKIPTPKFGIFDRENLAIDYIRRSNFPIVVANDFTLMGRESEKFASFSKARVGIQKIFESANQRIVIENYIDAPTVYVYFITDGYSALPLVSVERTEEEKYSTLIAPSQKVSDNLYVNLLRNAIYPILDDITKYTDNYVGIIGLKIKVNRDNFLVEEIYNGFQHYDFQAFLSLVQEDTVNVLFDTANGGLGDGYNYMKLKDAFSYTVAINKLLIDKTESFEEDFIESEDENNFIVTSVSATITNAQNTLWEYLGMILQEDVYNQIIEKFEEKELVY